MTTRKALLRNLAVGDIFHARAGNGASLVCLTTSLAPTTIYARRIHTQQDHAFDRRTGIEKSDVRSVIDCVTPFPPDIHEIFLAMDRKYRRFLELERSGVEPDFAQYKLTDEEFQANLSIDDHVASNPLKD